MDTVKDAARAVTSKPVQRAAINTILLGIAAVSLFYLAAIASALFFQNFIPDQFLTTPVHLQYGLSPHPFGITSLPSPQLKSQQDYDVSITLSLPRSPANIDRGNFMVSLYLLDSRQSPVLGPVARKFANGESDFERETVIFSSRRPALVPYIDPVVSLASRILFLFYHMLVPSSQSCTMIISLAERIVFDKDSEIPTSAYIEVEAGQNIQIYDASLTMTAQLHGLRYLMFHYRLATFLTFTTLFWVCEVLFMSLAWTVLSSVFSSPTSVKDGKGKSDDLDAESDDEAVKDEPSDHPQTFPTYGKQPPLKYEPGVKKEETRERSLSEIPVAGAEADDEDEDDVDPAQHDSGIGTSYSEEGSGSLRRRTSRGSMR